MWKTLGQLLKKTDGRVDCQCAIIRFLIPF